MGDYESGYDPKYGYNRNAFATKTPASVILGPVVKLIATTIGLGSEAIHHHKDKKKRSQSQPDTLSPSTSKDAANGQDVAATSRGPEDPPPVYVDVPADQADELIASDRAVPADGETATHELVSKDSKDDGIERDEADWALDEAASATEETNMPEVDIEKAEEENVAQHPAPSVPPAYSSKNNGRSSKKASSNKLPFPVILPQRRPGTKARGFVRAYAPILQDSGIDQELFLTFLKRFHKAAQASPIFDVIMIATGFAGFDPSMIVGAALQAIQIAAAVGQEVQERYRTNKFLDQANKDFFMPKGLFALIVTYRAGSNEQTEVESKTIDLGAMAIAKYGDVLTQLEDTIEGAEPEKQKKIDEMREKLKNLRIASGETHGEAGFPVTCAPLTFPALDAVEATASAEQKVGNDEGVASAIKTKSKSASKFVGDYFDRRAQATYAAENPNSTLTTQMGPAAPQFKSRLADPNNATNMHFFTLITGGHYKPEPLGARRRYERAQRKAEEKRLQGIKDSGGKKRILQEGVLYLMIVNMPTEAELERARREVKEGKDAKDWKGVMKRR